MFRHVFALILERYDVPEPDREYIMAFYIHGLMAVITEWLKNDCADSIEHILFPSCRDVSCAVKMRCEILHTLPLIFPAPKATALQVQHNCNTLAEKTAA